jgi:hypothetical protein
MLLGALAWLLASHGLSGNNRRYFDNDKHAFSSALLTPLGSEGLRVAFSLDRRGKCDQDSYKKHTVQDYQQRPPPIQPTFARRAHCNILLFHLSILTDDRSCAQIYASALSAFLRGTCGWRRRRTSAAKEDVEKVPRETKTYLSG